MKTGLLVLMLCGLLSIDLGAQAVKAVFPLKSLAEIPALSLNAGAAQTIPGKGTKNAPAEWFGAFGIALVEYQNNFWPDDQYSVQSYQVKKIGFGPNPGRLQGIEAWSIAAPTLSPKLKFIASGSNLTIKPETKGAWEVWTVGELTGVTSDKQVSYRNVTLYRIATVASNQFKADGTYQIPKLRLDSQKTEHVFLLVPAGQSLSPLSKIATGLTGGVIAKGANYQLAQVQLDFGSKTLLHPELGIGSSNLAPENLTYAKNPENPVLVDDNGTVHLPWYDAQAKQIRVSVLLPDRSVKQLLMPFASEVLHAFCKSDAAYFYLTGQTKTDPELSLVKADLQGKLLKKVILPVTNSKDGFNIYNAAGVANLVYGNDQISLIMGRTMQKSPDGLNHQGSFAALFKASDLSLIKNFGQNSGHSFDNRNIFDGENFVGLDLGDNYPRGIIIHRMNDKANPGAVVLTYKTHHGTTDSPYRKGLGPGKWSNDNRTYTELGDVAVLPDAYAVLAATERGVDNANTSEAINEARNLALVLVAPNFKSGDSDIKPDLILSKGQDSPDFGFYTFDGGYVKQKNRGILWLTNYQDKTKENASHPKLLTLDNGGLLALWEMWGSGQFKTTKALFLDDVGRKQGAEAELGPNIRLNLGTRPANWGSQIIWATPAADGFTFTVLDYSE